MKVGIDLEAQAPRTIMHFEGGLYDALPPAGHLFIESRLRHADADRIAIACALILRDFVAAEIDLPKPCSPEVAETIEAFFAPLNVRIPSINLKPFSKPVSKRTAVLVLPERYGIPSPAIKKNELRFGIVNDQTFSSKISIDEVFLGCNLRLFSSGKTTSIGLGILGLCILFAQDMDVGRIVVPDKLAQNTPNWNILTKAAQFSNVKIVSDAYTAS